ncbi:hypothetical protein BH09ACT8_BH09ACT8_04290 [soil metagenome]
MVDLWVDPQGAGGVAAAEILGITALPTVPSTVLNRTGKVGVSI